MKIKKIISIVLTISIIMSVSMLSANAATYLSNTKTLGYGDGVGIGSVYLNKGETCEIFIEQISPYVETNANTSFPVGAYRVGIFEPVGYKTNLGLSINNGQKCYFYKTFKLNMEDGKAIQSYVFKASKSGLHHVYLKNNTKVSKNMRVHSNPTYRLTVRQ